MWNIVFVGVWWTGMSSLASLMYELEITNIVWIDSAESEITKRLQELWMTIFIGHNQYDMSPDDMVIYSAAAKESPEVLYAHQHAFDNRKKPRPPLLYHQFLWEISKFFSTIAITGTHGKSTTTAITWTLFKEVDQNFWLAIVAASVADWSRNSYVYNTEKKAFIKQAISCLINPKISPPVAEMKSLHFIVEADEYNKHFLFYDVDYALITNIELDHIDIYKDLPTYQRTFETFIKNVRHTTYICQDALWTDYLKHSMVSNSVTWIPPTIFSFTKMLWWHNHRNASLAKAVWQQCLDADEQKIINTINSFSWMRRRWELLWNNTYWVPIYSDYAHHPTEIESTLTMFKSEFPEQQIACIFQPHQLERLLSMKEAFLDALQWVDNLLLFDVYAARENISFLLEQHKVDQRIQSAHDFWRHMANLLATEYTEQFDDVTERINQQKNGKIVVFTAWNLDYLIRNWL